MEGYGSVHHDIFIPTKCGVAICVCEITYNDTLTFIATTLTLILLKTSIDFSIKEMWLYEEVIMLNPKKDLTISARVSDLVSQGKVFEHFRQGNHVTSKS